MSAPPPPPVSAAGPHRPTAVISKGDRVRDLVALVLVLVGIVLILVSHAGMQRLASQPIVVAKGQWASSVWTTYAYIDYAGRAAAIIGIIVGIASYIIHRRRVRASRAADQAT